MCVTTPFTVTAEFGGALTRPWTRMRSSPTVVPSSPAANCSSGTPRTVMTTGGEVADCPRSSVATAAIEYVPAGTSVHANWYGGDAELPMTTPFARKSTRATAPSLSDALAPSWIVAGAKYCVPAFGACRATAGGALATTVTDTGADVATAPALSLAFAVIE